MAPVCRETLNEDDQVSAVGPRAKIEVGMLGTTRPIYAGTVSTRQTVVVLRSRLITLPDAKE